MNIRGTGSCSELRRARGANCMEKNYIPMK